jgi:hypothetical protein
MFGLFKSSNQAEEEFIVFKSKEEKYRMLFRSLSEKQELQIDTTLLYFFKDSGNDLLKLCEASGITFCHNRKPKESREILSIWSFDEFIKQQVEVSNPMLSSEFYPTRSRNKQLLVLAGKGNKIIFYTELDNAYFKAIGMERIIAVVDRLGIKENEPISHKMIARSIVRGQEKFEKKIISDKEASSLEDLVLFNVKK